MPLATARTEPRGAVRLVEGADLVAPRRYAGRATCLQPALPGALVSVWEVAKTKSWAGDLRSRGTAGSGDPRRSESRRRGRETRAEQEAGTAGSGDPRRSESRGRRGRETRADQSRGGRLGRETRADQSRGGGGVGRPAPIRVAGDGWVGRPAPIRESRETAGSGDPRRSESRGVGFTVARQETRAEQVNRSRWRGRRTWLAPTSSKLPRRPGRYPFRVTGRRWLCSNCVEGVRRFSVPISNDPHEQAGPRRKLRGWIQRNSLICKILWYVAWTHLTNPYKSVLASSHLSRL